MYSKLGFSSLRNLISSKVLGYKDWRDTNKISISVHDVILSGFACMFYQYPSMLQFQRELEKRVKTNNLKTQFGVSNIPSSTQLKEVLDNVDSSFFDKIFAGIHKRVLSSGLLSSYQNPLGSYYISLDGTQYYTSTQIKCKKCLVRHASNGKHYSHKVLQGAIVNPDTKMVIPVMPVDISNELGKSLNSKQDCERKAFVRSLSLLKNSNLDIPFTFLLDGLFATQPDIEELRKYTWNFIITSKPRDNKYLHEEFWLVTTKKDTLEINEGKYIHKYTWSNGLHFNHKKQIKVNLLHYSMLRKDGASDELKEVYKNSWITDHLLNRENVAEVARGGRARWRVENECFNTLKNQGYHLEHSYGHGEKNLCFNFYILTVIAFYIHQLLEHCEQNFKRVRKECGSKRALWEKLRTSIDILVFASFESLLEFWLSEDRELISMQQLARAGPELVLI